MKTRREKLLNALRHRAHNPQMVTTQAELWGDRPCANPPATPQQLTDAERVLSVALPPLLHDIYTQVGNGGLGPGYGLLPLEQIVENSLRFRQMGFYGDEWQRLVVLCDWGCWIQSCLDLSQPRAPVVNVYLDIEPEADCLEDWLANWLVHLPPDGVHNEVPRRSRVRQDTALNEMAAIAMPSRCALRSLYGLSERYDTYWDRRLPAGTPSSASASAMVETVAANACRLAAGGPSKRARRRIRHGL